MIKAMLTFVFGCAFGAATLGGWQAWQNGHQTPAPYAGQDQRAISSLSADDVAQLETGAGWGLAKPAELNGFPGPAHILELAGELDLSESQQKTVQDAFDAMNAKARDLGSALIEAEAALDAAFTGGSMSSGVLQQRLTAAESVRAALRQVHLAAHLEVTPVLTAEQKELYAQLRGYGDGRSHSGH